MSGCRVTSPSPSGLVHSPCAFPILLQSTPSHRSWKPEEAGRTFPNAGCRAVATGHALRGAQGWGSALRDPFTPCWALSVWTPRFTSHLNHTASSRSAGEGPQLERLGGCTRPRARAQALGAERGMTYTHGTTPYRSTPMNVKPHTATPRELHRVSLHLGNHMVGMSLWSDVEPSQHLSLVKRVLCV